MSPTPESAVAPDPRQNGLLAVLPESEYERLSPQLEPVALPLGKPLYESGDQLSHVYFPTSAIVSLLFVMQNDASAEIAVVGHEGVVGVALFMGGETMPNRAVVQGGGDAYRLKAHLLKREFARSGALQHLLLRYTLALLTQMSQIAVCNRHHSADQQLCRWLLFMLDRLPSNQVTMTEELIARMLGVSGDSVSSAAAKLQDAGLITYNQGHVAVLNRPGLEARVCECYRVVKNEYAKLLPGKTAV